MSSIVKTAILVGVRDFLIEKYPIYFNNNKIYWERTVEDREDFPYCYLSTPRFRKLARTEKTYIYDEDNKNFIKTYKDRWYAVVSINISTMETDKGLSALEAESLACDVCEELHDWFTSDESIAYFNYDNDYYKPIAVTNVSDMYSIPDFEDTTTKFTYTVDVTFGFNKTKNVVVPSAEGAVYYDENKEELLDYDRDNEE